ncbi:MAG: type II toxin-antitoxin system HicB family antitoxin [Synergistaceae bacterium]|nr:type II toxin-antitoxin system HicB family antitoxin [Synergistaceae bacterium]
MREKFIAVIHREEELYVAECPEIGSVSQGRTIDEALANLREATELYIEETGCVPQDRALITTIDVAVNA